MKGTAATYSGKPLCQVGRGECLFAVDYSAGAPEVLRFRMLSGWTRSGGFMKASLMSDKNLEGKVLFETAMVPDCAAGLPTDFKWFTSRRSAEAAVENLSGTAGTPGMEQ